MFAAVPITAVSSAGKAGFAAHVIVVRLETVVDDQPMTVAMGRAFAALMIQQRANVIDLPAMTSRGAEDAMRSDQIGDQKASAAPQHEGGPLVERFPIHDTSQCTICR